MRRLLLVVGIVLAGIAGTVPAGAQDRPSADRVVVVGVPGLTWDDVDATGTPAMWDLAGRSAIGSLSVRAARSRTCVVDGWATLGAGNRAAYPEPDTAPDAAAPDAPTTPRCQGQERLAAAGPPDPVSVAATVAADDATRRFGSRPGALGRAVGCATAVGGGAALAAAAPGVSLTTVARMPGGRAVPAGLLTGCPLTLVSLDALAGAEDGGRAAALREADDAVGRLRTAAATLPGRTLLVVVGVSEVDDGFPRLHVAMVSGPGFERAGWLTSASTGRSPFVQLIDVAPTVVAALGGEPLPDANGQPMSVAGGRPGLLQAVPELRRADVAATVHYRSSGPFFWLLVGLDAALVALGMHLLGTRRDRAIEPRGRPALRTAALALSALPAATYLAGLVPWERAAQPALLLAGAVLLADLVVLAVSALGPWRRHPLGPPLAVLAITLATLLGDVVTGSHLELDGLLGYDAVVAGRFTGLGNLSSALLSVCALLCAAAAAAVLGRGRPRVVPAAVAVATGLLVVAVIGAPGLGRDFGGVLATLPGFLLLALLLARARVTVPRLAAVLGAGVLAVGALAVLDRLRPPAERSHLGRFVEQLRTGEAWTVVSRKAGANGSILLHSPLAWLLVVAAVAAWWLVRRGGLLRSGAVAEAARDPLRAGLVCCALTLAIGAAVNDSGVAVPAVAVALLLPLLVALAVPPSGDDAAGADAVSGRGRAPRGVTVGSRGSTDWNT